MRLPVASVVFGRGEKPVRGFGHGSRRVGLFLGDLQKHLLTQRECRLVRVLLKYE